MTVENKNQTIEKKTRNTKAVKIKKHEEAFKEIMSVYDSDLTDRQALRKIRKIVKEQLEG
jgi:uncharacterized protein (UPF0147 family)